ncbi:MAG: ABC transporter substrate-binding protein [Gammaproteobacteria bacterium]|nr:ABC transporter substrate-binding protein [Gammaproteobacteria bacterium]
MANKLIVTTSAWLLIFATNCASAAKFGLEIQPERKTGAELKKQETNQVRIAQQFGLGYLPLMIVRQHSLIEKHASAAGIGDVQVVWNRYPSGDAMSQALRAGFLDIASGGVVPLLRIWDRTREGLGVKGIATLSSMPLYLNTNNPKVKTLKDFADADRIALPAVKESIQAVVLQMAAAQAFGRENYALLDRLTVSMAHPDGFVALMSDKAQITAHLTSPPFQYEELENPNIHKVLSSYDVLNGPATFTTVWTRSQFRDRNPRTFRAVYNALREAVDIINKDKRYAAEIYVQQADSSLSVDTMYQIISKPEIDFSTVPLSVIEYAEFMHQIGAIGSLPEAWTEVFFPEIHRERGS